MEIHASPNAEFSLGGFAVLLFQILWILIIPITNANLRDSISEFAILLVVYPIIYPWCPVYIPIVYTVSKNYITLNRIPMTHIISLVVSHLSHYIFQFSPLLMVEKMRKPWQTCILFQSFHRSYHTLDIIYIYKLRLSYPKSTIPKVISLRHISYP